MIYYLHDRVFLVLFAIDHRQDTSLRIQICLIVVQTMSPLLYMILNKGGANDGGVKTTETAKRKKTLRRSARPDGRGYNMSI